MTYLLIFITHLFIILCVPHNCISFFKYCTFLFLNCIVFYVCTYGLFVRNNHTTTIKSSLSFCKCGQFCMLQHDKTTGCHCGLVLTDIIKTCVLKIEFHENTLLLLLH